LGGPHAGPGQVPLGLEISGQQLGLQEQLQGRKSNSSGSGDSSSSSKGREAELQQGVLSTDPHTDHPWSFNNGGTGRNGNPTYSHTRAVHEALFGGSPQHSSLGKGISSSRRRSSSSGSSALPRPPSHELKRSAVLLHGTPSDGRRMHTGYPGGSWDALMRSTSLPVSCRSTSPPLKPGKAGLLLPSSADAAAFSSVPVIKTAAGKAGLRQQNAQDAMSLGRALQPAAGQQKLQPEGKKGSGPAGHRSSSPGWTSYPTGNEKDDSDSTRALTMKDRKGSLKTSLLQKPTKHSSLKLR